MGIRTCILKRLIDMQAHYACTIILQSMKRRAYIESSWDAFRVRTRSTYDLSSSSDHCFDLECLGLDGGSKNGPSRDILPF